MEQILDDSLIKPDISNIKYGSFWQRFGASVIDGLVLIPISFLITFVNLSFFKSPFILIIATVITTAYKPFMEFVYGATWGKMAVKIKVKNLEYEQADLLQILLRNIFHLAPSILTLIFTVIMFNDPDFESVSGLMEFGQFSQQVSALRYINYTTYGVIFIDSIVLVADSRNRSLHDMIGGTVVVQD